MSDKFEGELEIKQRGPTGWDTPENVALIIEKLSPALQELPNWIQSAQSATRQSIKMTRFGVIFIIALIVLGAVGAVLIDVWKGNTGLAEKVLIPLISFAGGLGLSASFK